MGQAKIPNIVSPSLIVERFTDSIGKKPVEYCLQNSIADKHIRIRKGQFNVILGHPSTGKTTWIIWYLYQMAYEHKLTSMIYSGENDVQEIYSQLVQCFTGKVYWEVSEEEHMLAASFIHNHFFFIDDREIYTAEQLFERFKDQNKCDICVIDPHNSVKIPENRNWYEYSVELGMQIRAFCKDSNKTVFLCAHPVTKAQRETHKDGEYTGMLKPPIGPDMEGGSTMKNKCDNLWIIHRYVNHNRDYMNTQLTVEKIRYQNTGVKPTFIDDPIMFRRTKDGGFNIQEFTPKGTFEDKINELTGRNNDAPF